MQIPTLDTNILTAAQKEFQETRHVPGLKM